MVVIQVQLPVPWKIRVSARLNAEESIVVIMGGTRDEHSDGRLAETP
jgi:hypothetical protein